MPNLNVPFAGRTLIIPGAYYDDDVSGALGVSAPASPPLLFLGYGYNTPFVPQTVGSPQELAEIIRGGPAASFIDFLMNPSSQLNGAQQVTFINCGPNTAASAVLNTSGSNAAINLVSVQDGLPSNLLQRSVQTATVSGAKITLFDGYSGNQAVGDNLGVPFSISYLGTASASVAYSVVQVSGSATVFSTTSPNSGESLNVPLGTGNYSTIAQLVAYINGTGAYSARILSSTNGALPSASLDTATAVPLTSGGTSGYVFATLTDPVFWINNLGGGLASGSLAPGVSSLPTVALVTSVLTPFSGATSVPPSNTNFASGFNIGLTLNAWTVFAGSNNSGVIALGQQHVTTASQPENGKRRRFFTGSSIGDSITTAVADAQSMDSIRCTMVYPGIYRTNTTTGLNQLYDGLHAAAAVAGMATGNAPATPLTNKSITGNGVEVALTTSQIDQLQQGGVMPIWNNPNTGVPTIVSDLTTWQVDNNPENVFNQQVACRDYLSYATLKVLNNYVGTIASPPTEVQIANAIKTLFNVLVYTPNRTYGVLAAWDPTSLVLTYNGQNQLLSITVNATFVGQNRFITCTVDVQPLNIIVAGSTPTATVL